MIEWYHGILHNICEKTGFHRPVFFRVRTEFLSLYGRIQVSGKPYLHIFHAVEAIVTITRNYLFNNKTLSTYSTEIKSKSNMNSRNLTALSDDINNFDVLTSNLFLIGTVNPNLLFVLSKRQVTLPINKSARPFKLH